MYINLLYVPVMGLNRPAGVWHLLTCTTPSHAWPDPAEIKYFSNTTSAFSESHETEYQLIFIQQYMYVLCTFKLATLKLFIGTLWYL